MKSKKEILDILRYANGTESCHSFSSLPGYPVITDGVYELAEAADCYWLLDVIGSYQNNPKLDKSFQVWKLIVNAEDSSAVVQGYNDKTLIVTQEIPCTDFPLNELTLYLINRIVLLPSEN